ncbi:MAG TPA: type II toxin-antitoxin system RelE/ParE family toxin [Chloroflexota bacterium]|nr:type II toxin-antitoxin system RelE/ParE family toxin [Chloroflexota bacterium]
MLHYRIEDRDTYRAVYTVHFIEAFYALRCFQKKATQ